MGTNYYIDQKRQNVCDKCGRGDIGPYDGLHIGKSSAGWVFALHIYPEHGIKTFADWLRIMSDPSVSIRDEYTQQGSTGISLDSMLNIICGRAWRTSAGQDEDFHRSNHSENGPNGLSRSKIDGVHCTGHGIGTWDYMQGEFS